MRADSPHLRVLTRELSFALLRYLATRDSQASDWLLATVAILYNASFVILFIFINSSSILPSAPCALGATFL